MGIPMPLGWRSDRRRSPLFAITLVGVILLICFLVPQHDRPSFWKAQEGEPVPSQSEPLKLQAVESRYAYATFLVSDGDGTDSANDSVNDDNYFIATRILAYQLLHSPETRTPHNYPFIVMVNKEVSEAKRDRLRRDGAIIWEPEPIDPKWIKTPVSTWRNVMTKLRLWELVQYERICFLDGDTVLLRDLDGVFEENAVETLQTGSVWDTIRDDEGKLPSDYAFAGIVEMNEDHHYPPTEEAHDWPNQNYLNAGFFVMKPGLDMLNYYISLTDTPNRFEPLLPEQNLLNYAHRPEGSMPWRHLDTKWNMHYPTGEDIKGGVYSLHEKWWNPIHGELGSFLESWRWRMEGYWEGRDAASGV